MIACDNTECHIQWFHTNCLHITKIPKGKWFWRDCCKQKKRNTHHNNYNFYSIETTESQQLHNAQQIVTTLSLTLMSSWRIHIIKLIGRSNMVNVCLIFHNSPLDVHQIPFHPILWIWMRWFLEVKYRLKISLCCGACSWTTFELILKFVDLLMKISKLSTITTHCLNFFLNSIGIVFISSSLLGHFTRGLSHTCITLIHFLKYREMVDWLTLNLSPKSWSPRFSCSFINTLRNCWKWESAVLL